VIDLPTRRAPVAWEDEATVVCDDTEETAIWLKPDGDGEIVVRHMNLPEEPAGPGGARPWPRASGALHCPEPPREGSQGPASGVRYPRVGRPENLAAETARLAGRHTPSEPLPVAPAGAPRPGTPAPLALAARAGTRPPGTMPRWPGPLDGLASYLQRWQQQLGRVSWSRLGRRAWDRLRRTRLLGHPAAQRLWSQVCRRGQRLGRRQGGLLALLLLTGGLGAASWLDGEPQSGWLGGGPGRIAARQPARRPPQALLSRGPRIGGFQMTFYWVAEPATDEVGEARQTLYDTSCRPIARVGARFARSLILEGTGRLRDGRLLNVARRCSCPLSPCFFTPGPRMAWGAGVKRRPLSPFRSVAVDPRVVSIGSRLYIPELDGVVMPGAPPWGGFVHDGCVVADDQGGGIRGRQLDFFAARRDYFRALSQHHDLDRVTAYRAGGMCPEVRDPRGPAGFDQAVSELPAAPTPGRGSQT
jgi:3D (Asp-Asp-Asp) domain-containing protein